MVSGDGDTYHLIGIIAEEFSVYAILRHTKDYFTNTGEINTIYNRKISPLM